MPEMSDFQKKILLGRGAGQHLFTQKEFDDALEQAKTEIIAWAIDATRYAILIEREECAKLADECVDIEKLGDDIRNRKPVERQ